MSYRTILLELVDDPQNDPRIECGRRLAVQFGAELVGIHISPPPFIPVGFGEGAVYVGPEIFEAPPAFKRCPRVALSGVDTRPLLGPGWSAST